ncbi:hypothetical protein GCM10014719_63900 [Planomonospora parontospora subsp. antibiotica]|nr:hypothetical protein GCM10014719_63900 [Planomonospora parontospora subsp. antibiotica]GII19634.1 hypothetical protein Ppa05_63600 [Planomonospora parontospora subsp. antibiotica]
MRLGERHRGQALTDLVRDALLRADADLVLPYLRDPRPRVRAEAVRTLRRLGARVDVSAVLEDPAPVKVRGKVRRSSRRHTTAPQSDRGGRRRGSRRMPW